MTPEDRTMGDRVSASKGKRQQYASVSMARRRQRILSETRALIDEKGIEGVTIQVLSDRAGVAQKTLYNAFGDKETIIARTIDQYQDSFNAEKPEMKLPNIDGVLNHLNRICRELIIQRQWARATTSLYFSWALDNRIYDSLRSMAILYFSPCLNFYAETGDLLPWVPIEIVELQFSNAVHGVTHDWAMGRISDDIYPHCVNFSLISALIPLVSDTLRESLSQQLSRISAALTNS